MRRIRKTSPDMNKANTAPQALSRSSGRSADARLQRRALRVHEKLLEAYGEPTWRNHLPPIDELVSTILSQNTNDINRDRAFTALRGRFPSWEAVRDASQKDVVETIRVAGLANQKGPRIQDVLRKITAERGNLDLAFLGDLPLEEARSWLTKFHGVGPKTAAIVLQFSLNRPAFPVDTHIYRVTGRIGLRSTKMSVEQAHVHLEKAFRPEMYYAAHLNLIRLGREVCHPRKPDCPNCPIRRFCDYEPKTKSVD
jgi:endonuclease-3